MRDFIPKRFSRGAWITKAMAIGACAGCYLVLLLAGLFAAFGPLVAQHIRWIP